MPARPKRLCPVPLCGAALKPHVLMCAPCWRRITRAERKEFRATWEGSASRYLDARAKVIQLAAERR